MKFISYYYGVKLHRYIAPPKGIAPLRRLAGCLRQKVVPIRPMFVIIVYLCSIKSEKMDSKEVKLIDIRQVLRQKAPSASKRIPGFVVDYLIRTIHQEELNSIILRYHDREGVDFMEALVGEFGLTLQIHGEIPERGSYIFASNHPLGGLDGICLSALIGRCYDGKIRYLVNDLLLYLRNLQSIFVPINKHGAQAKENALKIEEAYASDNQIITFPAGLCSRKIGGKVVDLEWKKSFIQKAVQYRRDIVPVFFDGQNSARFYRVANLRKALGIKMNYEMILLPDEMFRARRQTFAIHFGKPIPWETFDNRRKPTEWADWVKQIVYQLK